MRKTCTLWMVPLLICSLLVTGCSPKWKKQQNEPKYTQTVTAKPGEEEMETGMSEEDAQAAALEYLGTMTLQQKIGQLFMVNLELLDSTHGDYYEHQKVTREMKRTLQQYPVGGVILGRASRRTISSSACRPTSGSRCMSLSTRRAAMSHGSHPMTR